MTTQRRLSTVDEFWEYVGQHPSAGRLELSDGEVIEVSPAGEVHGLVGSWLAYLLAGFVVANDLGEILTSATGFVLSTSPARVRAPDSACVAKARLTAPSAERFFPSALDLAVEIISPSNTQAELQRKLREYCQAGARLVWVLDPPSRTSAVYRSLDDRQALGLEDTLDGGDLLSDLRLPVRAVFAQVRD